jgi:hypothetical protein
MQCFTAQLNYIHYFSKHEMMYLFVQEDSEKTGRVTSAETCISINVPCEPIRPGYVFV